MIILSCHLILSHHLYLIMSHLLQHIPHCHLFCYLYTSIFIFPIFFYTFTCPIFFITYHIFTCLIDCTYSRSVLVMLILTILASASPTFSKIINRPYGYSISIHHSSFLICVLFLYILCCKPYIHVIIIITFTILACVGVKMWLISCIVS